ncbi:glycosyltransferase family 2 protein [Methanosarcina mazei]|nr:glycosyltransferase family A protein [Methanosarcina mazei]
MPLVSVVIPLYNKESHIKRAIDSILDQRVQNFEIVVVDDGSTDKSAKVVKNFTDPRIRLIQQENAGVSAARNKGIEEAKSDLIAFLDADDEWMPNFLEIIMNLKQKYPKAGIYATAYSWSNLNKIIIPKHEGIPSTPWEGIIENYFSIVSKRSLPISASSVVISKKILFEVGMFQPGLWKGEDQDVWGKIALKYPVAYNNTVGSIYYLDATNRACRRKKLVPEIPFMKIAKSQIKNKNIDQNKIKDLNIYIENLEFELAYYNLLSGNYVQSIKLVRNCSLRYIAYNLLWYSRRFIQKRFIKF